MSSNDKVTTDHLVLTVTYAYKTERQCDCAAGCPRLQWGKKVRRRRRHAIPALATQPSNEPPGQMIVRDGVDYEKLDDELVHCELFLIVSFAEGSTVSSEVL